MIVVGIIAAFVCVVFLTKGAFSPARLFAAMWAALIIGYYIFSDSPVMGIGLWWIVSAILVFAIGENIGVNYIAEKYKYSLNHTCEGNVTKPASKILFLALLLFIICAVFGKVLFLYSNGYDFSVFFNIDKFVEMNKQMAADRYNGETQTNNFITLLSSFGYVAPLCGGYLLSYSDKSKAKVFLCILSLFPVLLSMAIDNTKSGVLDAVILFVVGFMISFMKTNKRTPKIKGRHIAISVCLVAILFLLLFISMCVRVGDFSASTISDIKDKFIVYAFGSVEAFDVWITKNYSLGNYGFGVNTFMAPFDLLGIVTREQGVYGFVEGAASNVFTSFRAVITDFGIFGGLIFMFLSGILAGTAYKKIQTAGSVGSQFIYAGVAFYLLHGYLGSPWVYTSFWVAFFVFLLFLALAARRARGRQIDIKYKQAV